MFDKILIANRGEIACRVIRTARRLGVATVAVYSDADAGARHVRMADEALRIGPAPPRESYLRADRIVDAAVQTGAQAIHPGYGFLSENADFADACSAAGVVFIGPPAAAIRAMGSKSAAKQLMEAAGVPLTPGYHGERQDTGFLADQAAAIGYPVLIKASAGGGGKGMRRVDTAADFDAALASCLREAANAFGDERVLIERYVLKPRHVEIQVFGDSHGHVVHLFERDCSVQRRHQKVLEEAPAPGMTAERRAEMGRAAVEAARAVGYVGAGTVEFIVEAQPDGSPGRFFFMEMNTRLQVEHPVTELITGQDLVEWQLRVAAGQPLPLAQQQLQIVGHAIEARVYAEDPDAGFLPSTGRLHHLAPPPDTAGVRVDTGVEQGDVITPHYDPMIAKLIVHGADRAAALARLRQALARYRIAGVRHNVEFLGRLVATRSFAEADLDTGLIEREQAALFPPPAEVPRDVWLLAALFELQAEALAAQRRAAGHCEPDSPWRALDGWRVNGRAERTLSFRCGDATQAVTVRSSAGADGCHELVIDGECISGRATLAADGELRAQIGERRLGVVVVAGSGSGSDPARRQVFVDGRSWPLQWVDPLQRAGSDTAHAGSLRAPMPGKVIGLQVAVGQRVEPGAPLLVMEAMKMEHTIAAPAAGVVKTFHFSLGDQVGDGDVLLDFEAEASA